MAARIDINDLIRLNPGIWLETHGYINVNGKKVRPKLNVLQRRINALYVSKFVEQIPCWAIGVKPRKRGFSTMVGACHYTQLNNFSHEGIIIGDKLETSDIVFRMIKYFAENDEFKGKLGGWGTACEATAERMKWKHGSLLHQGTASGKATARGATPQFLHGTETAHWEGADEAMDAALNAIPDEGFVVCFLESTPKAAGEPFALKWDAARWPTAEECPKGKLYWKQWESLCPDTPHDATGLSRLNFVRVFAAWYEFEESRVRLTDDQKKALQDTIDAESWYRGERKLIDLYGNEGPCGLRLGTEVQKCDAWEQLAWRRWCIKNKCRGSIRVFNSEHPPDPKTCFLSAGAQVFDEDALTHLQILCRKDRDYGQLNEVDRRVSWLPSGAEGANFWRWEGPKVGCRYIIPVDLAEGKDQTKTEGRDRHSALVLRDEYMDQMRGYHPIKLAARVRPPNEMPMIPFAKMVKLLSLYYGRCVIIPEMNNSGMSFIMALRMMQDCPPIWQRTERDPHSGIERAWDGFRTTDTAEYGGVRSAIIWHAHDILRRKALDASCPHLHSELVDFVDKNGRMEAGSGKDDDVMALCIGLYNIRFATLYAQEIRQPFFPPEIAKLLESQASDRDLAMKW